MISLVILIGIFFCYSFSNTAMVTVPIKHTFNGKIKSIISINCSPCHVSKGKQTNYMVYYNAKTNINTILERINKKKGRFGFMPKKGEKLNQKDLDAILKWKTDGLLEK